MIKALRSVKGADGLLKELCDIPLHFFHIARKDRLMEAIPVSVFYHFLKSGADMAFIDTADLLIRNPHGHIDIPAVAAFGHLS